MIPHVKTENLKNHTPSRGTFQYSPYMGVPSPLHGAKSDWLMVFAPQSLGQAVPR